MGISPAYVGWEAGPIPFWICDVAIFFCLRKYPSGHIIFQIGAQNLERCNTHWELKEKCVEISPAAEITRHTPSLQVKDPPVKTVTVGGLPCSPSHSTAVRVRGTHNLPSFFCVWLEEMWPTRRLLLATQRHTAVVNPPDLKSLGRRNAIPGISALLSCFQLHLYF